MPLLENAWREVTRSTVSDPEYRVAVTVACNDVLPENGEAWLYVGVQWALEPGEEGPEVMEDPYAITLRFVAANEGGTARIAFVDHADALVVRGNGRHLVRVRAGAASTTGMDHRLVVSLQSESEKRLPLRIGAAQASLALTTAEGGALPRALAPGAHREVSADREPDAEGRLRWYSAPHQALAFTGDRWNRTVGVATERRLDEARFLIAAWGPPRPQASDNDDDDEQPAPPSAPTPTTEACIVVHRFEPQSRIVFQVGTEPLRDAWVAWREGDTITQLWSDHDGVARVLRAGGDREAPWDYTEQFTALAEIDVQLQSHHGARPLPEAALQEAAFADVWLDRHVTITTPGAGPSARATAAINIIDHQNTLVVPAEYDLWPLTHDPYSSAYLTEGLQQAAAAFNGNTPRLTDFAAAPAAAVAVRPHEHGLLLRVRVPATVTAATLRIIDRQDRIVALRSAAALTSATVQDLPLTLAAPVGDERLGEAVVACADAASALGPVHVLIHGTGPTPGVLVGYTLALVGLQAELVDDHEQNANGQERGPWHGAAEDVIVMDFTHSPRGTTNDLKTHFRVRRMSRFATANGTRPIDPTQPMAPGNPDTLQPQMPLWMGALAVVGIAGTDLAKLLHQRLWRRGLGLADPPQREDWSMSLHWRLDLSWYGPDAGDNAAPNAANTCHWYMLPLQDDCAAAAHVNTQGAWVDAAGEPLVPGADGVLPGGRTPAPDQAPFPIANRRLPGLVLSGVQRPWGRRAGQALLPSMLIEFQPLVTDGGDEKIRGGNGALTIEQLQLGGSALSERRRIDGNAWQALPVPATCTRPAFRIVGTNPPDDHATLRPIVDTVVRREFDRRNGTDSWIPELTLAQWQETVWRVFIHESRGQHYWERGFATIQRLRGHSYGRERLMPLFGGPHGYGFGQLDTPRPDKDSVWSWLGNIMDSADRCMGSYASFAYGVLNAHPRPAARRFQACLQRQIVRRYNGGSEFIRHAGDWWIDPSIRDWEDNTDHSKGANLNLNYPNGVLGSHIVYFVGAGAATVFPRPIQFNAADYGPGI